MIPIVRMMLRANLGIIVFIGACSREDVGAPCNHGTIDPPPAAVVTWPTTSCSQLICIYNDEATAPGLPCQIGDDEACNPDGGETFECAKNSLGDPICRLSTRFVLEHSMCSKVCQDDDDCRDRPGHRVVAEGTRCESGFQCVVLQALGDLCCEKLCVCGDELDLAGTSQLADACAAGTQQGCCVSNGNDGENAFVAARGCGQASED